MNKNITLTESAWERHCRVIQAPDSVNSKLKEKDD